MRSNRPIPCDLLWRLESSPIISTRFVDEIRRVLYGLQLDLAVVGNIDGMRKGEGYYTYYINNTPVLTIYVNDEDHNVYSVDVCTDDVALIHEATSRINNVSKLLSAIRMVEQQLDSMVSAYKKCVEERGNSILCDSLWNIIRRELSRPRWIW